MAQDERVSCTGREVRALVEAFLTEFNSGNQRLDRLFAKESEFQWYSTQGPGARLQSEAYDRGSLTSYFERRHQRGERLELRSFQFNGHSAGYGHFEYGLVRSAADLPPTDYYGKGAAICRRTESVIAVWSMGRA